MKAVENNHYVIGIDFGTLSARAALIDINNGAEYYSAVYEYGDGVIEGTLPGTGIKIDDSYSLQNPSDYEKALVYLLKKTAGESGVHPERIVSIGIDFTACTIVAMDDNLRPLSENPEFRDNPHSWSKLWKHHGAKEEAKRIDEVAISRNEEFLKYCGNKTFDEWMFAKALETFRKAPDVYNAASYLMEAGDWMTYLLTGNIIRSCSFACCKACWSRESGYPSREYLDAVEDGFGTVLDKLYSEKIVDVAECVGYLTPEMAKKTGLSTGTAVAAPIIDAHAALPAYGMKSGNTLMLVMGTSICNILHSRQWSPSSGMLAGGKDIIIPGLCSYESSLTGGGDLYNWIVNLSKEDFKHMNAALKGSVPGTSGLIALDWLNGNRCILKDPDLSGMIMGITLKTTPEEIYRALVESTAFAVKVIIEDYESSGLKVDSIISAGGIAVKSPEIMQVFADILDREISTSDYPQPAALGMAIYAATAAGPENFGYESIDSAIDAMSVENNIFYHPNASYREVYDRLFDVYKSLYNQFGRDKDSAMKKLLNIKYGNITQN